MKTTNIQAVDSKWASLYRICGVAALVAGIVFRRNIAAEIILFAGQTPPNTVADWFTLLQNNSLLGVSLLNIFDVVNYALVGIMFLGLYVTLKQTNRDFMALAATLGLVGTAVYLASNTAFSMLSLSNQYATTATETEKTTFLAAGQTLLAMGQSTGVYTSLLLVAVAGFITSVVMLKSKVFGKVTAYVGILAGALDLIYCVTTFAFMPELDALFLASAGLCLMIWHILAGRKLYQLGQINQNRRCNS
jgi:hypothetical protein